MDPERITRLYNVMGLISAEDRGPFHGPAGRWIETLASLCNGLPDERVRVLAVRGPGTPSPASGPQRSSRRLP